MELLESLLAVRLANMSSFRTSGLLPGASASESLPRPGNRRVMKHKCMKVRMMYNSKAISYCVFAKKFEKLFQHFLVGIVSAERNVQHSFLGLLGHLRSHVVHNSLFQYFL